MFAIVSTLQEKISKVDCFLPFTVSSKFTFRYKHFSLKIFSNSECKKLKKILLAFEICFQKIKKRVNWSNNIVKTKKYTISIEIGIF